MATDILTQIHGREIGLDKDGGLVLNHDDGSQTLMPKGSGALTSAEVAAVAGVAGDGVAAPTVNLSAAVGTAGVLTGTYYYTVAFRTASGVTAPGPGTATSVAPAGQQVNLTSIPLGGAGTTGRVIMRTKAASVDPKDYFIVGEISDNTTTTYTDNTADGSLGAAASWAATNAGFLRDGSGALVARFSDQSTSFGVGTFAANAGYASVAVGFNALADNTSGRRNTAVGVYALENCTDGYQNAAFGTHAGGGIVSGIGNAIFGYAGGSATKALGNFNALHGSEVAGGAGAATVGQQNVGVGYRALYNINTADQVVALGPYAGQYANASRQLFIDTGGSSRANLAAQQDSGLVYGKGETTAQTQVLHFNAAVRVGWGTATVAQLPAAGAGLRGFRAWVGDASVAYTSANVGSTVAGGGANAVPVFCNGTNWVIG